MIVQNGVDELIERIESDGNHRVLRRLQMLDGFVDLELMDGPTSVAAVVDVETTGMDPESDTIIEIAVRRFRHDPEGRIAKIDRVRVWRQDPGHPLGAEIVRLTGITDADLVGQSIDGPVVERLLKSSDLVIAHNATFDRRFVERRLPGAAGLPWACSCREIDWPAAGFDGRALGWLLWQSGWFHAAHRASNDVDAVIALLGRDGPDGRPLLAELLESSACPSVRVEAVGADFAAKDGLRARGYRWEGRDRVWWKEIQAVELPAEQEWLERNVYAPECRPRAMGPWLTAITARERYV